MFRRCIVTVKRFKWIIDVDDETRVIVARLVDELHRRGWVKYDYTTIKDQVVYFTLHLINSAVLMIHTIQFDEPDLNWYDRFIDRPSVMMTWDGHTASDGEHTVTLSMNDDIITVSTSFSMEYGDPGYGVFHDIVGALLKAHGHPIRLILPGSQHYHQYQLSSEPRFDPMIIDKITDKPIKMVVME